VAGPAKYGKKLSLSGWAFKAFFVVSTPS